MKFVNKYLRNFTPYKLASHKIWNASPKERAEILKLDWNEATILPAPNVTKRLKKLVEDSDFYNLYPSTNNEEIMELLSDYIGLPKENIQYFAGSDSLHEYIAKLYITVGDPILILGPSYDNFRLTAEVCGGSIHFCNMGKDFLFHSDTFELMIDEIEPSLVYICNPNNPTGVCHTVDYIESLLVKYPQVLFLVDEAYAEFSHVSAKELVKTYENIIISRTMSKAFAIANFRFGYLLASRNNIDYISSIRNPKNITTFAQEAAIGALSDISYMENYVEEVNKSKLMFENEVLIWNPFLSYVHGEGNFLLIKCASANIKTSIIEYLENNNIFVRNLSQTDFLREYCFRITIGTREQMRTVIGVMERFFDEFTENSNS